MFDVETEWYGVVLAQTTPPGDKFLVPQKDRVRKEKDDVYNSKLPLPDLGGDLYPMADPSTTGTVNATVNDVIVAQAPDPNGQQQVTIQDLEARSDEKYPTYKWKMDIPISSTPTKDGSLFAIKLYQDPDTQKYMAVMPEDKRIFLGNDLINALRYLKRSRNVGMSDYLQKMEDYGPWIK